MGTDADVYDKWAQAINSSYDLVKISDTDWTHGPSREAFPSVVPILVVPNDMLWVVDYDSDGNRTSTPRRERRIPFYLDKQVSLESPKVEFRISHLEIMTVEGLMCFVSEVQRTCGVFDDIFPSTALVDKCRQYSSRF